MKFFIFNIKLRSETRRQYDGYVELFETAVKQREPIFLSSEKQAVLRENFTPSLESNTLFNKDYDNLEENLFFYGSITKFTHITNHRWLNIKTNKIEDNDEIPKDKFPNAIDINFFFFPQSHRMFVEQGKLGVKSTEKFIQQFFAKGIDPTQEHIDIHIEQSSQIIDSIKNAKELHNLEIVITPTNDDPIANDVQKFFDQDSKQSKSRSVSISYKDSEQKKGLIVTNFMTGILNLAKRNGVVTARIFDGYKKKTIKTTDHPDILEIPYEKGVEKKDIGIKIFDLYKRDE